MSEFKMTLPEMISGGADGTAMILLEGDIDSEKLDELIEKYGYKKEEHRDIPGRFKGNDAYLTIRDKNSYSLADYLDSRNKTHFFEKKEKKRKHPNLEKTYNININYGIAVRRSNFNNHLPQDAKTLGENLSKYFERVIVLDEFPYGEKIYDSKED